MLYTLKSFTGAADLPAMISLAQAFPASHLHAIDLPYRFSSWALEDPANLARWVDEQGQLAAWAALQPPFWSLDYACRPAMEPDLHTAILAWGEQRARQAQGGPYARPAWFVNVFASQAQRRQDLEAAGFTDQSQLSEDAWSKVWLRRPAELPVPSYRLPTGFVVRPLAGAAEAAAYVELHRAVFDTKNMTLEWRLHTLQQPDYRPDLDLVVAAPDGRLGAFCIAWLAPDGRGQIEPLGCHKDFRRYALGRLALVEALRRLQAAGAQDIYVETDNYRDTARALYESQGFELVEEVLVYGKKL